MENMQIIERMDKVFQVEATVPSKGDFMLTHVPFENLYLSANKPLSEKELLNEFLLKKMDKHKLIMVQGDNGSGKSHLIRWLYEKYVDSVDSKVEKVMLISRAHNTLQDTLKQMLKSDIFPEEIRKTELDKIKNAQTAISGAELKKTVNFNFTLVIDEDIEKSPDDLIMSSAYLPMLRSFLLNPFILETFLMKKNGPLDRICSRLNNLDNKKTKGFEGDVFSAKDFDISLDQIKNNLTSGAFAADKPTVDIANRIYRSADFRSKLASYLNSKVDSVIQKSLKLNTADFKNIFDSLRTELKKQGMRLSLFVEDINAFSGIDLALMEVILANHEADGNEDYCRLCSVVGTTIDFYNNRLNESIKERIKQNGAAVFLREESLFGNDEKLSKFAAKYINACHLTERQVKNWESNGCDEFDLPIAENKHEFAAVECFGHKMSIFPFNITALSKMYDSLNDQSRTPRRFLMDVIYPIVSHYYLDGDAFLTKESDFLNESISSLPTFISSDEEVKNSRIGGIDKEKRGLLVRIWGDGTVASKNGLFGGVSKEILDTFKVSVPESGSEAGPEPVQEPGPEPGPGPEPKPQPKISAAKTPTVNPEQTRIENAVSDWFNSRSKAFANDLEMRGLISKFIYGNLNWDAEEIPRRIVETYVGETNKYIFIEGNPNNNREGIVLERNEESQELFYSLIKYKYEGKNSWNFKDGFEWFRIASTWLLKHKQDVLRLMKPPYAEQIEYEEVLIWALYTYKTYNGGFDISNKKSTLLKSLFSETIESSGVHCEEWEDVKKEINKIEEPNKYVSNVLSHFSHGVGAAEAGETKYTFINASKLLDIIKKIEDLEWSIKKVVVSGQDLKKLDTWTRPLRVISYSARKNDEAVKNECLMATKYLMYFKEAIGDCSNKKNVDEAFIRVEEYLRFLLGNNLGFDRMRVVNVQNLENSRVLSKGLERLKEIEKTDSMAEKISMLSQDPFTDIAPIYDDFMYVDKLISEKNKDFAAGGEGRASDDLEKCREDIAIQLNKLISLVEKGV